MDAYEWTSSILGFLSLVLIFGGLIYAGRQVYYLKQQVKLLIKENSDNQEWNRRKTSLDINLEILTEGFSKIADELNNFDISLKGKKYNEVVDSIDKNKLESFDSKLDRLLNYCEMISIGIKNNIIDKEISFDYGATMILRYYDFAEEFIKNKRNDQSSDTFCINLENLVKEWKVKVHDLDQKMRDQLVNAGKEKLG
ncbi:DUF4760 domain-containing protein [Flagellimonas sediminis]|uniref:DUF4760 domain-containing protein n=1 Tax=Flagellimonas sediminis TaxID=2696468 RepID=A0A6I5KXE9_9FLAO|nr:DUF4760 domain-containing protein [Allomuricauda sediminis]NDV43032.1 DUF4760 domain-containing protein [Allomuricauda sediminis]